MIIPKEQDLNGHTHENLIGREFCFPLSYEPQTQGKNFTGCEA